MGTLKERILHTLEVLNEQQFNIFQWYLQQPDNLEGLQPIPKRDLENADRMKTVDLIVQSYPSNGAQIVLNILKKIYWNYQLERFLAIPNVHEESISDTSDTLEDHTDTIEDHTDTLEDEDHTDTLKDRILNALGELKITDFQEFKRHLQQTDNLEGLEAIPWNELGEAKPSEDTVDLIMEYYPDDAEQIVINVLQKICKYNIEILRMFPGILKATGSNEKKRKRNQEELSDDPDAGTSTTPHDPDASTSTIPRKWLPVSERWKPQLQKLVIMDESEVKKIKSLVFRKDKEFRIGEGSNGVEVFLGLRDDGTEVAVKRMSKTHNLYNDLKNDELHLRLPELDDSSIVRYVDFVEDKDYGYLALQLCEYTLEEYITELPEQGRKRLAKQVLNSLRILHCQDSKILHRDIKPQNVLIDSQGKARLADFGISRRIDKGKTTCRTSAAGTPCWMAKETLVPGVVRYKRSTDIQPAGMLIYYILSGGHHPFGDDWQCEVNIRGDKPKLDHVDDMVAKDLVEWMIHGEPERRPKVEQCFAHPFFWPNTRREEYLRRIGNEKEVEKHRKAEQDENKAKDEEEKELIRSLKALDQYAEQGQFNAWKQTFREAEEETRQLFEDMDEHNMKTGPDGKKKKFYSDNSFGLLRFIRNLHAHYAKKAAGINLMEMFPGLFGYVYKFAKEQGWNSRPALKEMFDFCQGRGQDFQDWDPCTRAKRSCISPVHAHAL